MTTTKKMTEKDYLNALLSMDSVCAIEGMEDFLRKKVSQIENRKHYTSTKPSAKQVENEHLKDEIVLFLDDYDEAGARVAYRVTDLIKLMPLFSENYTSTQKVSALMTQLVNEGRVCKGMQGKNTVFSKAD